MYAFAASRDYDPGPGLEKIKAPLLAINSADDLINPPELRILEHEIKRVPRGTAIVIPFSLKDHLIHTASCVHKRSRDDGHAPTLFDAACSTKKPFRFMKRVRINTTGKDLS